MKKHFVCIAAVFSLLASGCSSGYYHNEIDFDDPEEPKENLVEVHLKIGIAEARDNDTRAGETDKDYYFENAILPYEKLSTLRVIIVNKDGNVEHNRFIRYQTPSGKPMPVSQDDQVFKVTKTEHVDEDKDIYLFGNELNKDGWENNGYYPFNDLKVGDPFPKKEIEDLTIAAKATGILFDNSSEETAIPLPMNEQFHVTLTEDNFGTKDFPSETFHLFLTRSAVKFSFEIDPDSDMGSEGFRIEEIYFKKVGLKEYLLPKANYLPDKYVATRPYPNGGRLIDKYELPSNSGSMDFTFNPENFGLSKNPDINRDDNYNPALYFVEGERDVDYQISIKVRRDGDPISLSYDPQTLPNLSAFPRNTYVRVVFKLTNLEELACQVILEPYISVDLDPIFGDPQPYPENPQQEPEE